MEQYTTDMIRDAFSNLNYNIQADREVTNRAIAESNNRISEIENTLESIIKVNIQSYISEHYEELFLWQNPKEFIQMLLNALKYCKEHRDIEINISEFERLLKESGV